MSKQLSEKMAKVRSKRKFNNQCSDGSYQGWASQSLRTLAGDFGVKNRGRMNKETLCEKMKPFKKGDPLVYQQTGEWNKWKPSEDYDIPYSAKYRHYVNPKYEVDVNNGITQVKFNKWTKRARDAKRLGRNVVRIEPEKETLKWISETNYKKPKKEYIRKQPTITERYKEQKLYEDILKDEYETYLEKSEKSIKQNPQFKFSNLSFDEWKYLIKGLPKPIQREYITKVGLTPEEIAKTRKNYLKPQPEIPAIIPTALMPVNPPELPPKRPRGRPPNPKAKKPELPPKPLSLLTAPINLIKTNSRGRPRKN